MSAGKARNILLAIWSSGFLLNLAIAFYLYLYKAWMEADNFGLLVSRLDSLYVTYLGLMIAFYLTRGNPSISAPEQTGISDVLIDRAGIPLEYRSNAPFIVAMAGSIIWNVIILLFVGRLIFGLGNVEEAISQVETYGSLLSWIVAPAIGFYFGNISKSE